VYGARETSGSTDPAGLSWPPPTTHHILSYQLPPVPGPATSSWFQGPVLRPGGSQAPAPYPQAWEWARREAIGNQTESTQQHRWSGVTHYTCLLSCTCKRAFPGVRRSLLLISGDVERNPGPVFIGAQWNAGGLSQPKRLALTKKLHDEGIVFCLLMETHLGNTEVDHFSIDGYQHIGQARTAHGGGVSIVVRDGIGVIPHPLQKHAEEKVSVTLQLKDELSLSVTSAYFPRRALVTPEALERLGETAGPHIIGADVNSHHPAWDTTTPPDTQGERIIDWCLENDFHIANTGLPTRRKPNSSD